MCVEYNITPQTPSPSCATAPVPHFRSMGKKCNPSPDQLFQHSSLKILLTTYFKAFSVSTHHYNSLSCSNTPISLYFQDVEKYLADRGNDVSGVTWSVNGTLIDTCEYYTHLIIYFFEI